MRVFASMGLTCATGTRTLFALLFFPGFSFAARVSGVVVDPQDLAVRGARIELACADGRESVRADDYGHFTMAAPSGDGCVLSVTYKGFASFRQLLTRPAGFLVVRLQVAAVEEHVSVVAERAALWPSIGSVSLSSSDRDLRTLAGTTQELIRYAQLMAGTSTRRASIYVDGLPGGALPALDAIAQISINADPFSAERADGDVTSIDIITKAPARTFRFFMGGDLPGIVGHDMLAPALRATSRWVSLGVQGPVPGMPLTFMATAGVGRASQEMPIQAVLPGVDATAHSAAANRHESGSASLYYAPTLSLRARFSFRESRAGSSNAGVGGLTLQEAGFGSSFLTRESRATATKVWPRFLYEGAVVIGYVDSSTRANSLDRGITVGGAAVMGGASISESRRTTTRWTSRHVVRSRSSRPWTVGIVTIGADEGNRLTPNSAGSFYFSDVEAYENALADGKTGTWSVTRGGKLVRFSNVAAAPFVQTELVHARQLNLSAGVRADYQSGFGMLMSPRISLATQWRGVAVRAGAGMFVQSLPASIFISAMENDGQFLQQFVANDVSLTDPSDVLLRGASFIHSRLAADLTRPRTLLWRLSVERPVGRLSPALEYSVAADRHLLGSDRRPVEAGWVDVFQSNRSAMRQRLHAQLRHAWKRQQLVVDYEFTHARDNTDGPFSFLEQPGNLTAEWGRSAGMSPHTVTVMGTLTLPAAISVNLVESWRSSAPFNITTALDTAGKGLALDRGGRERNSGDGPQFNSLSLYAHRRMDLSNIFKTRHVPAINLSVQVDNLLNERNDLAVGSIIGSTTFGKPLATYPGRSVRVLWSVE
jgi:hypothetical protein